MNSCIVSGSWGNPICFHLITANKIPWRIFMLPFIIPPLAQRCMCAERLQLKWILIIRRWELWKIFLACGEERKSFAEKSCNNEAAVSGTKETAKFRTTSLHNTIFMEIKLSRKIFSRQEGACEAYARSLSCQISITSCRFFERFFLTWDHCTRNPLC